MIPPENPAATPHAPVAAPPRAADPVAPESAPYRNASLPIGQRVEDLLGRMTLEEKISQLTQKSVEALKMDGELADPDSLRELFGHKSPGVLFGGSGDEIDLTARRLAACKIYLRDKTRLGIPALTSCEALHGVLSKGATIYPQFLALGCTWNPELAREMGSQIAREASAAGLNQVLGPVIEVARDPRWGRVEECISENPFLVECMGLAYTLGLQGDLRNDQALAPDKCLAMLKHFAAHSAPVNGINIAPCIFGERELRSVYFPPFETIIRETGVLSVMPSYNEIDGIPAHVDHWLLEDVLRGEMGFQGYTYSDWEAIDFSRSLHRVAADSADAALQSIQAGVDLEAPDPRCYQHLGQLVADGKLPVAEIDKACTRVLYVKFAAGLFEAPSGIDLQHLAEIAGHPEHVALSERIAAESIVLLKNDNQLLPLDPAKLKSIAVIGPNADQVQFGDYCWSKNNQDGVTILRGLRERLGDRVNINYAKGCDLVGFSKDGFSEATEAAKQSDVAIVVLGDTSMILSGVGWDDDTLPSYGTVGEGFDVTDPVPPGVQQDLVRAVMQAGKPVIVVFLNGRPYSVPWMKDQVPAIVEAFYPGQQQGYAVADILIGKSNPSGRLSMSVPQSAGHIPTVADYKPSGRGYYQEPGTPEKTGRDYVFSSPAPLWAFGHGLSYTEFTYSDLQIETPIITPDGEVKISFTLANTGQRVGKEVVQIYVHQKVSSVTTPMMRLVGFEKIELHPGETRRVSLTISASQLALWNRRMKRVVEPSTFSVMVAASAEDVRLLGEFIVKAPQ